MLCLVYFIYLRPDKEASELSSEMHYTPHLEFEPLSKVCWIVTRYEYGSMFDDDMVRERILMCMTGRDKVEAFKSFESFASLNAEAPDGKVLYGFYRVAAGSSQGARLLIHHRLQWRPFPALSIIRRRRREMLERG